MQKMTCLIDQLKVVLPSEVLGLIQHQLCTQILGTAQSERRHANGTRHFDSQISMLWIGFVRVKHRAVVAQGGG